MVFKRMTLLLTVAGLTTFSSSRGFARDAAQSTVNWSTFLTRHDLVWDKLPTVWHEGAFVGNGLLGTMIYSEGTNVLQWDVGRSDVVDRGGRIAIGRFVLVPEGKTAGGTMRLDLWNAEARGVLLSDKALSRQEQIEWRAFTHADKLVNVIELSGPPAKLIFQHQAPDPAREIYQKTEIPAAERNPEPAYGETGAVHWCLQRFKAGGGYVVAWGERNLAPGRRVVCQTVDFVPDGSPEGKLTTAKATAVIQAELKGDYEKLVSSHRDWWHNFYPRSFLSIPDTRMESFYWIQMYKLASATRAERPALDLAGPWFRTTPWPKLWWNLNIQLTYWPVYAANRLDLGESLTRMIDDNITNLIDNVPAEWRADSAAIGRSASYDCVHSVKGRDGEERGDLTWALHNYWLQYRYSGDEQMLRDRLYPILKRAAGYYLHLLKLGDDGKLHLPVSISPEYPKNAPDTNYDLGLLRWALQTLLAINERFHLNDPLAAKWEEILVKLTPFPVDEHGYMIGAGVPFAQSHRHFSHLLMVYPLHVVDPESPEQKPLIIKTLNHWHSMPEALRGYSYTGGGAISAWVGNSDQIVPMLNKFLEFREGMGGTRYNLKANTMYTEAGPVIETPLAGAATIHEMVLQSWSMDPFGTHIRVFPALPAGWKDVSFDKLLAEGAFEVSAVRKGGKTKFVQIKSLAGAPCRVRTGLEGDIVASGSRTFIVETGKDKNGLPIATIDLKKGETVLLTSAGETLSPGELTIEPVAAQPNRLNFYGSAKADK
jgi:hypothetical protein